MNTVYLGSSSFLRLVSGIVMPRVWRMNYCICWANSTLLPINPYVSQDNSTNFFPHHWSHFLDYTLILKLCKEHNMWTCNFFHEYKGPIVWKTCPLWYHRYKKTSGLILAGCLLEKTPNYTDFLMRQEGKLPLHYSKSGWSSFCIKWQFETIPETENNAKVGGGRERGNK